MRLPRVPESEQRQMKSELFWDFMQRRMVIPYRYFGTILKNQAVQLDF